MRLLRIARDLNEEMPKHVVELLVRALNEKGLPMKDSRILVLGLTYRGGVREFYKLLKDKIDLTAFMVWFIENFPESFKEFKENPEIQWRFK